MTNNGFIKLAPGRRFPNPARAAELLEQVSLVRQECRTRTEAVAVGALLLSQTDEEAGQQHGYRPDAVRMARTRLRKRCLAKRRARR
jgi:hypothetical protein